jgi:membrane protease YdiL (CAAX protease family)
MMAGVNVQATRHGREPVMANSALRRAIIRRPLVAFFTLAFLGSWLVWSPWWASRSGIGLIPVQLPAVATAVINAVGVFAGPFTAAFIVVRATHGKAGVRELRRRIVQWRTGWQWWLFALIGLPALLVAAWAMWPGMTIEASTRSVVALLIQWPLFLVLGGPLGEEPGWRGYALPQLQGRMQPTQAALALGAMWCLWHAPLFLTREWDTPRSSAGDLLAFAVFVIAASVILSWITNNSQGSVLLAIVGHNSINVGPTVALAIIPAGAGLGLWPASLTLALLALAAIVVTRGMLGYRPSPAVPPLEPVPGEEVEPPGPAPTPPSTTDAH